MLKACRLGIVHERAKAVGRKRRRGAERVRWVRKVAGERDVDAPAATLSATSSDDYRCSLRVKGR